MTSPVVRAPRSDNQDLCIPDHQELCFQVLKNRDLWLSDGVPEWIVNLRQRARQQVASAAIDYTQSYTRKPSIDPSMLWVVGGHQPEAFHPGVWYKNFLIDALVKKLQEQAPARGLHVIIDHDLPKSLSIKIPSRGHQNSGHLAVTPCLLPIDDSHRLKHPNPLPWHQYQIASDRIESSIRQMEASAESLGLERPMAREFFESMPDSDRSIDAARAISQARHRLEIQAGLENLDLPMSLVCQTQAWCEFVEYCFTHAPELLEIYNASLDDYRAREKITNPGQPVAHLSKNSDWLELPLWLYRPSDQARNRLWLRTEKACWELGSGARPDQFAWTTRIESRPGALLQAIRQEPPDRQICLRPRALITTLFLRCFLADGFVHGIGGGIYDRLTDDIIRKLLRIEPPSYTIATATLQLPLPEPLRGAFEATQSEMNELNQQFRAIRSAPQKFLTLDDPFHQELATEHARLLDSIPPRGQKKIWHRQMVELKKQIRQAIYPVIQSHQMQLYSAQRRAHEAHVLSSREYSMLLFPKNNCIARLKSLASQVLA